MQNFGFETSKKYILKGLNHIIRLKIFQNCFGNKNILYQLHAVLNNFRWPQPRVK